MKTFKNNSFYVILFLLAFIFQSEAAAGSRRENAVKENYLTIMGKVVDAETGTPLVLHQCLLWNPMSE